MRWTDPDARPCLTADLPGTGGILKRFNEDFQVDEIPLYEPSGAGTHTYFVIEKNGVTTWQAVQNVARALRRNPRDIGYAGMKDAHAVTRQMLSLEHVEPAEVERVALPRIRILRVNRHTNKIKLGHLRGNRFDIRVREAGHDGVARAHDVLSVLVRRGVPNYFGEQRFGTHGDNALVGLALVQDRYDEAVARICGRPGPLDTGDIRRARELFDRGDYEAAARAWPGSSREQQRLCEAMRRTGGEARRAWRSVDRKLERLYVSALQSELFNRVLAARLGRIDRLHDGDAAWKHDTGAVFLVENAAAEQPRCDAFEISPSGPLFGRKMKPARGLPGQVEADVLTEAGLSPDELARDRRLTGGRRSLRFRPRDTAVEAGVDERGPYLRVAFTLESGCYATTVMREICKSDPRDDGPSAR